MTTGLSTRSDIGIHFRPAWINLSVLMALTLVGACRTRGLQETAGRLDSRGFGGKSLTVEETMAYLPLKERGQFAPIARKWMRTDTMWRVARARVLAADYSLLRKDFPALASMSEAQIRDWLVEQAGFVSDLQTHPIHVAKDTPGQSDATRRFQVNSLIPLRQPEAWQTFHDGWAQDKKKVATSNPDATREEIRKSALAARPRCKPRKGVIPERCSLRPPTYERAVVLPVYLNQQQIGLIDIKGVGVSDSKFPAEADTHATGLLPTGEALREYFVSKLVGWVLERATIFPADQVKVQTLGHYAVLDLGFADHWRDSQGRSSYKPVGLLLRQAHNRDDYYTRMIAPTVVTDDAGQIDFEDIEEDEKVAQLPVDIAKKYFPPDMQMKIARALFAAGITTDAVATLDQKVDLRKTPADIQFALNRLTMNGNKRPSTVVSLVDFGSFGFISYHDRRVKESMDLDPIFKNDYSLKNSIYGWGPRTEWRPNVEWKLPDGRGIDLSSTEPDAHHDSLSKVFYELAEYFKVPLQGYPNDAAWKTAEQQAHDHLRDIFIAFERTMQSNLTEKWTYPEKAK
jgi:hypothetical protein